MNRLMILRYSLKDSTVQILKEHYKTLIILVLLLCMFAIVTWLITVQKKQAELESSPAAVSLGLGVEVSPYTDLDGNGVQLSQYLDSVIVVNSWASWSPASAKELQLLASISAQYDSGQVYFLAINRSEPASTVQSFLKVLSIDNAITLLLDSNDTYYSSIDGFSMPETLIYDKKGNIVQHFRGAMTESAIVLAIDKALVATQSQ